MHILIVSHKYPNHYSNISGIFVKDQAEALAKFGHDVGVISPLPIRIKELFSKTVSLGFSSYIKNGVLTNLFSFPSLPKLKRWKYYLINKIGTLLLDRYINANGIPDIIHLHVFMAVKVANYANIKYTTPIVYTEHFSSIERGLLSKYELNLVQNATELSNANIAVSKSFAKALSKLTNQQFIYVQNVYDSNLFNLNKPLEKYDDFAFINVGWLDNNKNQTRLINAFKYFQAFQKNSQLILVGDGPKKNKLINLVKSYKIENNVKFLGLKTSSEIKELLLSSHVFILSSNYETFGVSLIEALACGLPVISTKCGGPESIITTQFNGVLCEQDDELLFEAMKEIFNNYDRFDSERIADYAIRKYSHLSVAKKLTAIYEECID